MRIQNHRPDRDEISGRLLGWLHQQKEYHDSPGVRELLPLVVGQYVKMQTPDGDHGWLPAVVREKCTESRSYHVETSNGAILRRYT